MIDPKELRTGNLGFSTSWGKAMAWGPEECGHQYYGFSCPDDESGLILCEGLDKIDPIPLTPEWLERLGFIKDDNRYLLNLSHNRQLDWWGISGFVLRNNGDFGAFIYDINNVHQLQNLYFALTGTELELH